MENKEKLVEKTAKLRDEKKELYIEADKPNFKFGHVENEVTHNKASIDLKVGENTDLLKETRNQQILIFISAAENLLIDKLAKELDQANCTV